MALDEYYDALIIGAGMSGLAAGIRLALSGKKVAILERHYAPGGLNSFYAKDGRRYDVGLHAMTNYSPPDKKGTPLAKVFRQLRIPREEIDFAEQGMSQIAFPDVRLGFSNDYRFFESEVARDFPHEIDNFRRFVAFVREHQDTDLAAPAKSARKELGGFIKDPLLREMLLCPLMYYGSAEENDMDFTQLVTLFKGIFLEGFARPFSGVRTLISALLKKFKELGGSLNLRCGVKSIQTHNGSIQGVILDNGNFIRANYVFSSAGLAETVDLCSEKPSVVSERNLDLVGKMSFAEIISVFSGRSKDINWDYTITFFSNVNKFQFHCPDDYIDLLSGVICLPDNYNFPEAQDRTITESFLRVTAIANYEKWKSLDPKEYEHQKEIWFDRILQNALSILGGNIGSYNFERKVLATDMFTPRTIERYTWHKNGAVYGSPIKVRNGNIGIKNLFICGTDQGFHGIVGAMLSGITIANQAVL